MARLAQAATAEGDAAPVLEELAGDGTGWMPLLPVARWLKDVGPGFDRFLQTMVLDLPPGIDAEGLTSTLSAVIDRHDLLRCRLVDEGEGALVVSGPGTVDAASLVRRVACEGDWARRPDAWRTLVLAELDEEAGRLDPRAGVVARFVWFDAGPETAGRLLVVLHHVIVDGVSWRVLLPDLAAAWSQIREGHVPRLPAVGTSVRRWAHALVEEAASPDRVAELGLWRSVVDGPDPLLGGRRLDPAVDVRATVRETRVELPVEVTEAVLSALPTAFRGEVNDGLLAALALALVQWRRTRGVRESSALIRLEGHGREEAVVPGADLARTVGWFTSAFPVRLDLAATDLADAFAGGEAAGRALKAVKEQLRAIPDKGIGYGLLRHLNPDTALSLAPHPIGQVSFNYLGRFSAVADMPAGLRGFGFTQAHDVAELAVLDAAHDPRMPALAEIDINAAVTDTSDGPCLSAQFAAPEGVLAPEDVRELADLWCQALTALTRHVAHGGRGGLTPSDAPLITVAQTDIDRWEKHYPGLSDIWPTSPFSPAFSSTASCAPPTKNRPGPPTPAGAPSTRIRSSTRSTCSDRSTPSGCGRPGRRSWTGIRRCAPRSSRTPAGTWSSSSSTTSGCRTRTPISATSRARPRTTPSRNSSQPTCGRTSTRRTRRSFGCTWSASARSASSWSWPPTTSCSTAGRYRSWWAICCAATAKGTWADRRAAAVSVTFSPGWPGGTPRRRRPPGARNSAVWRSRRSSPPPEGPAAVSAAVSASVWQTCP
ncbi:hypothetical protein SMD44_08080 [Streptomyces alboflavus]|uniref:Condensation domain-containing protein n=1 Tax=Streptomyces alboflavus TaxID=67267 RepID=A0A1Z1WQ87_9ACTN|nr:hypothetical protein SMD44_08080 [Streptomyces alboflavus]